ncbi:hypothetical protein [Pseudomonas sp. Irchel 3E13]|uniref:hypothetical protein n=1 Tax=Pseudomonas sp. Irchel 3E13 TaxID=2008975 RepID=UPI000BA3FD49|nr:hypothetical protein [Pseudomonas sp. Irchel 3E13]
MNTKEKTQAVAEKAWRMELDLEEKLVAAGLGYPLSKEEAVKAYKAMLEPRTDTPENADCDWCYGVGHDYEGDPCVGCCFPTKAQLPAMNSTYHDPQA